MDPVVEMLLACAGELVDPKRREGPRLERDDDDRVSYITREGRLVVVAPFSTPAWVWISDGVVHDPRRPPLALLRREGTT